MSVKEACSTKIRCFVCLEPSPEVCYSLEKWIARRRSEAPALRWVRPQALHLTLKFCGEISPETVAAIAARLREVVVDIHPFRLSLEGTGTFPPKGAARVLWGGIKGNLEALQVLYEEVEQAAAACGLTRETRPFSPHLTLARIRSLSDLPSLWAQSGPPGSAVWGEWLVRELVFMQSELRREGPLYSPIERYSLR